MSVFDGIDPDREAAIRQALTKEVRHRVANELRETIRRQVHDEVRADVLREVAERAPTAAERQAFRDYVREVRLDAYAQAELASSIAERAEEAAEKSRSTGTLLTLVIGSVLPITMVGVSIGLGSLTAPTFIVAAATLVILLVGGAIVGAKRVSELARRGREHSKISSEFLILAERAKAYAMVHADRIASSEELHDLLEELRHDKERQDRLFDPSVPSLEASRAAVQARFEEEERLRLRVAPDRESPIEDDELSHQRVRR